MSSIRNNIYYSAALTFSTYLVPLVVFPYISRVLGVENIGAIDAVDNIIDYCILFSMMGISTLGIRETAKHRDNPERLSQVFSSLFSLNAIATLIVFAVLLCVTFLIEDMRDKYLLLSIGCIKLFSNLFWIEWFFRGLELFRYITIRSIIVRLLFVASVFLFVHDGGDSVVYYLLFVAVTFANAVCNWNFRSRYVSFDVSSVDLRLFLKPFVILGVFGMLSAIYTKLSTPVLAFICDDAQAGLYSTTTRIHHVINALIASVISVLIPRVSILVKEQKFDEIRYMTDKAFSSLFFFSLPVIVFAEFFAEDILSLFAGGSFVPAANVLRIVIVQVLVIGIEQILILQLLIPMRKDKMIVIAGLCGVAVWMAGTLSIVPIMGAKGSAFVWLLTEMTVAVVALIEVQHKMKIYLPIRNFIKIVFLSLPYVGISLLTCYAIHSPLLKLVVVMSVFVSYAYILWRKKLV